jgi:hypothetical protein
LSGHHGAVVLHGSGQSVTPHQLRKPASAASLVGKHNQLGHSAAPSSVICRGRMRGHGGVSADAIEWTLGCEDVICHSGQRQHRRYEQPLRD